MATFDYRRELTPRERLQAVGAGIGAGVGVGLITAYLARLLLQRTPLRAAQPGAPTPPTDGRP